MTGPSVTSKAPPVSSASSGRLPARERDRRQPAPACPRLSRPTGSVRYRLVVGKRWIQLRDPRERRAERRLACSLTGRVQLDADQGPHVGLDRFEELAVPDACAQARPASTRRQSYCSSCSRPLFQYRNISSALGTFAGRTSRKPSHCASVWYQILFGSCGSCCFQAASEGARAAAQHLRRIVPRAAAHRVRIRLRCFHPRIHCASALYGAY